MQQIFAIAQLSIRNAVRSKIVISLLVLLLASVVLLPLTIKGDGTLAGFIQILLSYTLGLASFILALTTLWAGSAAVASEINDKTIQMAAVKPVSRWQIWMGKWLGLNFMNAVLLAVCGLTTYGLLNWHLHPSRLEHPGQALEARRLLTARAALTPRQPDVDVLARNQLEEQLAREDLPEGVTRMQRLREIRQRLLVEHNLVPPAGQRRWDFGVITGIDDAELTLQYRFSAARMDIATLKGRWLIGTPERIDLIEIGKESIPRALNEITFSLDQRWREQPLVITYVDGDPAGAAMIFDADGGLILLKPRGGFGANYVRALLIVFGQLSFFAALGVTAGCLFSLPVAAFVSLFLLTMIQMGGYIQGVAQTEVVPPWQAAAPEEAMPAGTMVVALVFKATAFLMSPLIHESALNSISTGRMVDVSWAFRGFILQGMVYSLLMSGLAAYVMNRRELALPPS